MALTPLQRQYRGLVMGPGTEYEIIEETGLETLTVRSGTRPAPRAAGSIPGLHVADSKLVALTVEIATGDAATAEVLDAALRAVMVVSESDQFEYKFLLASGVESFVWARVIDRPRKRDMASEQFGFYTRSIGFEVADPRIYSVEQHSENVPLLAADFPGFDLPDDLPFNMVAGTQSEAILINAGDQDAYPLCQFQFQSGGSDDWEGLVLTNETNGSVLDIDSTLTAGQILTADMDAYVRAVPDNLIVYIGGSSRFGDWQHPRDPFYLSPGSNVITFEVEAAGTPTTDAACLLSWRDTSL
jgi:hypothetical protein